MAACASSPSCTASPEPEARTRSSRSYAARISQRRLSTWPFVADFQPFVSKRWSRASSAAVRYQATVASCTTIRSSGPKLIFVAPTATGSFTSSRERETAPCTTSKAVVALHSAEITSQSKGAGDGRIRTPFPCAEPRGQHPVRETKSASFQTGVVSASSVPI